MSLMIDWLCLGCWVLLGVVCILPKYRRVHNHNILIQSFDLDKDDDIVDLYRRTNLFDLISTIAMTIMIVVLLLEDIFA